MGVNEFEHFVTAEALAGSTKTDGSHKRPIGYPAIYRSPTYSQQARDLAQRQ